MDKAPQPPTPTQKPATPETEPKRPNLAAIESLSEARTQVINWLLRHPEDVRSLLGEYSETKEHWVEQKSDRDRIEHTLDLAEIKYAAGMHEAALITYNDARFEAEMMGLPELAATIENKMRELGGDAFIKDLF